MDPHDLNEFKSDLVESKKIELDDNDVLGPAEEEFLAIEQANVIQKDEHIDGISEKTRLKRRGGRPKKAGSKECLAMEQTNVVETSFTSTNVKLRLRFDVHLTFH